MGSLRCESPLIPVCNFMHSLLTIANQQSERWVWLSMSAPPCSRSYSVTLCHPLAVAPAWLQLSACLIEHASSSTALHACSKRMLRHAAWQAPSFPLLSREPADPGIARMMPVNSAFRLLVTPCTAYGSGSHLKREPPYQSCVHACTFHVILRQQSGDYTRP